MVKECIYLFQGNEGFVRYNLAVKSDSDRTTVLPLGHPEIKEFYRSDYVGTNLIQCAPLASDFDEDGNISVSFLTHYIDWVVEVAHSVASNTRWAVSPSARVNYSNRLCQKTCRVVADILERSGLGITTRVSAFTVSNPTGDRQFLNKWKRLLCVVHSGQLELTFMIDPLFDVFCHYSAEHADTTQRYAFICYGSNAKDNVVVSEGLNRVAWILTEDGQTHVHYVPRKGPQKREPRIRKRVSSSGSEDQKTEWMVQEWRSISEEEAEELAPQTYQKLKDRYQVKSHSTPCVAMRI